MNHIVSGNELNRHNLDENAGADCNCFPNVSINPHTGDLFVIHKSFKRENFISQEDIEGIFKFAAGEEYEGGNIIVDEAEDDE